MSPGTPCTGTHLLLGIWCLKWTGMFDAHYNFFFSGFISSSSGKVFCVEVDNTDAMIFYSSQGNACASDMVGIVNPSKDKSPQDYKSRVSKLSEGVSPGHATFGGELADKGSSYGDSKSDDKDAQDAQDGKKSGNKSAQDIINSVKCCKNNLTGIVQVSTVALAGIFGAALYMLQVNAMSGGVVMPLSSF